MRSTLAVSGPAVPGEAWERYAVPARWPEWSPQIRGIRYAGERLSDGATGVVLGPVGVRVRFVVTAWDEPDRRWAWDASVGPVHLHLAHTVEAEGAGTRTTLVVEGPAAVVVAYRPIARIALRRLVAR